MHVKVEVTVPPLLVVSVCPVPQGLMLLLGESHDVVLDALLLQLLQLLGCGFGVDGLRLHHGCVCDSCRSKHEFVLEGMMFSSFIETKTFKRLTLRK